MKSLRARLTLTHTLVALIAVAIVAVLATALIRLSFDRQRAQLDVQQFQNTADLFAERLGAFYEQRGGWGGIEVFFRRQLIQSPQNSPIRRLHMQLFDAQGLLLFDTATPGMRRPAPRIPNGVESPIVVAGQAVGQVVVDAPSGVNPAERTFLFGVYLSVATGSVLAGIVALAVGLVITRRVTRPLRSLKDAARRLASGARHEPLAIPPEAELAELAVAFNTMAAQLEHQQQLRRQLVADIAHELRTPLSVLRVQIESLEDGIEQPTPATLSSLGEEVNLLTRLVDDLRLLSLADAGQLSLAITEIDAGSAIARAVTTATARARQQGVELRAERPAVPIAAAADAQRLTQILGNLIENALRYTPTGGIVTVRVYADHRPPTAEARRSKIEDRRALASDPRPSILDPRSATDRPSSKIEDRRVLTIASRPSILDPRSATDRPSSVVVFEVADTGPGIPPDELPQIFDRFYRTDKARARETGGSGLGLAIVQRLVEMQGGRIWASSALGHGATFHVALPAAS
jgi:signal transduction histidine kinase